MTGHSIYQLFDSHCHFDFDEFGDACNRRLLWQQCREQGISGLLIPGVEPLQWGRAYELASELDGVYMSAGYHPWFLDSVPDMDKKHLFDQVSRELALPLSLPSCVAVGECGLDALIDTDINKQHTFFEAQVRSACDHAMPLVIHVRKAHNEALSLLKKYQPPSGGVIHGFTGSLELAQQYWRLGFYLGVGGSITYPRANKTRKTVQSMPLSSLLLETDAPDMPLYGYQGQANSPLRVVDVAKVLAEIREESLAKVCQVTSDNAIKLFNFPISR